MSHRERKRGHQSCRASLLLNAPVPRCASFRQWSLRRSFVAEPFCAGRSLPRRVAGLFTVANLRVAPAVAGICRTRGKESGGYGSGFTPALLLFVWFCFPCPSP